MHGTNATVDQRAPSGGTAGLPVAFLVILGLSAILGIAFVAVVTPGIPYDEPSHWLNVLYYANHHWIPTIGDPSVSYEAQQYAIRIVGAVRVCPSRCGTADAPRRDRQCPPFAEGRIERRPKGALGPSGSYRGRTRPHGAGPCCSSVPG
jgi:hypothetical protein